MSDDDAGNDAFQAGLRWIAQRVGLPVERLEDLDLEQIAHAIGVDVDRAQAFADTAGQWLNDQAGTFAADAASWLGGQANPRPGQGPPRGTGPHPLDLPTAAQGLALSALDSGRWTVEAGSHVLLANGEGPAPEDAFGLVGELRARDWVDADGAVTLVGRNALKRWMDQSPAS